MNPSIKEIEKMDGNRRSYSIDGLNGNGRIKVEQDDDLVLKNFKAKLYLINHMRKFY